MFHHSQVADSVDKLTAAQSRVTEWQDRHRRSLEDHSKALEAQVKGFLSQS
jgi:hypothetical protein